jgi:hypothetical protein
MLQTLGAAEGSRLPGEDVPRLLQPLRPKGLLLRRGRPRLLELR